MEIGERLQLSESDACLAVFREGLFMRFYDAHLGWFCQQGKPLKVLCREVKKLQGRVVLYGGLPESALRNWLAAQVPALDVHEQPWGLQVRIAGGLPMAQLQAWCVAQRALVPLAPLPAAPAIEAGGTAALGEPQQQILHELNQLALISCTPLQALQWLTRWQGLSSVQRESGGEG